MRSSWLCTPSIWAEIDARLAAGAFASCACKALMRALRVLALPSSFFKVFVTLARFSATVPVASAAGELVAPEAAGILAGPGDERRLRARVLERQPHNFGGCLTVIGEKKRLVGIAHELRFDAEMPVPVDHVAQIRDDGARIGGMRPSRRFSRRGTRRCGRLRRRVAGHDCGGRRRCGLRAGRRTLRKRRRINDRQRNRKHAREAG